MQNKGIRALALLLSIVTLIGLTLQYHLPVLAEESLADPSVCVGSEFILALASDGTAWGWGKNDAGQLGVGTATSDPKKNPVKVSGGQKFIALSAGFAHAVALTADGKVYTWGENSMGQLGLGNTTDSATPTLVESLSQKVVAVAAGGNTSFALTADGKVYSWGNNQAGVLGIGLQDVLAYANAPELIPSFSDTFIVKIFAGEATAAAIDSFGKVWLWGENSAYQAGESSAQDLTSPVCKNPEASYQALTVALGLEHSSVLLDAGATVANIGKNSGQFGNGSADQITYSILNTSYHTTMPESVKLSDIASGSKHMIALGTNGEIYTWGDNTKGQLGQTGSNNKLPTMLLHSCAITDIAAAYNNSAFVDKDGHVYAWGANENGQVGNGIQTESVSAPARVLQADGETPLYLGLPSPDIVQHVNITANATIPAPTFSISIPSEIDFGILEQKSSNDADKIAKVDFTVTATHVQYLFGQRITVKVAPSTGETFVLTGTDGSTLPYAVYNQATGGEALEKDAVLASFDGNGSVSGRLEIDQSKIDRSETYGGTLIFQIETESGS